MVSWIDWQVTHADGSLLVNNACFGDWLNIDAMMDPVYLSTAYFAGMTKRLSRMAEWIGEHTESIRLLNLYEATKLEFAGAFFTKDDKLTQKQQTAAVLALAFDLCPNKNARKNTLEQLKHDIVVNRNLHLSTGFLGTPLLLKTLSDAGELDLAYDLLLQTSWPGWLYPVTQGATTMWERWNSWTSDKGFGDPEMNSFNHYAYGAVGDWFFETICGIQPDLSSADAIGFKHFILAPQPGKRLTSAAARYHSICGWIESSWNIKGSEFQWHFTIPANSTARVVLPDGMSAGTGELIPGATQNNDSSWEVGPGTYQITLHIDA